MPQINIITKVSSTINSNNIMETNQSDITIIDGELLKIRAGGGLLDYFPSSSSPTIVYNQGFWQNYKITFKNTSTEIKKYDIFWNYYFSKYQGVDAINADTTLQNSCQSCVFKDTIEFNANANGDAETEIIFDPVDALKNNKEISNKKPNEILPFGIIYTNEPGQIKVDEISICLRIDKHSNNKQFSLYANTIDIIYDYHSNKDFCKKNGIYGDLPPENLTISNTNFNTNDIVVIGWDSLTSGNLQIRDDLPYHISIALYKNNNFIKYITKNFSLFNIPVSYNWKIPNNIPSGKYNIKIEGAFLQGHGMDVNTQLLQCRLIDTNGKIYTRHVTDTNTQVLFPGTPEFTINNIPIKIPSENRLKGFTTKTKTPSISFRVENKFKNVAKKNLLKGYTP